jgi:hypothetical protein
MAITNHAFSNAQRVNYIPRTVADQTDRGGHYYLREPIYFRALIIVEMTYPLPFETADVAGQVSFQDDTDAQ